MEFKHLQTFAAVVKYNSFTKAADVLFLTQPTISSQIRQLEEELGVTLIRRTTKSIAVTEAGLELYHFAESILAQKDRMIQRCSHKSSNRIFIASSSIPSDCILPPALAIYRQKHPEITYDIHKGNSETVMEAISDGRYDIGLIGMPCQNKGLQIVPLMKDHLVLIMPNKEPYISYMAHPDNLDWLIDTPFIMREKGSGSGKEASNLLSRLHLTENDLTVSVRSDSPDVIKALVQADLGVSLISDLVVKKEIKDGSLLSLNFDVEAEGRQFYLIYQKNQMLPDYIREFVDFLSTFSL